MPADAPPAVDGLPPLETRVAAWFGASGPLARNDGFEERPQQRAMAVEVAKALTTGHHAVLEAGTGTGKTLAYLVPAVLSGRKVVVSTATKALQEQLIEKDLPSLRAAGLKFSFSVMKGRSNYLCLYRKEVFDAGPTFVSRDEATLYRRLHEWAQKTPTGDRAELEVLPEQYVAWRDVSATAETCLGQECPRYTDCHVMKMRQRAQEADVVVVNHHLFFADLALRSSPAARVGAEIVPKADAVIFDEAHNIEEVATGFFGSEVSNWRFFDLCQDVDRATKAKGSAWPAEVIASHTSRIGKAVDHFFNAVAALAPPDVAARRDAEPKPWKPVLPKAEVAPPEPVADLFSKKVADAPREMVASADEVLARAVVTDAGPAPLDEKREVRWALEKGSLESLVPLRNVLVTELRDLERVLSDVAQGTEDAELDGFVRRCEELRASLDLLSSQSEPNLVYWAEQRGRGVFLRASPVDVAAHLRRSLFDKDQPVIMASATLATGEDTLFFQRRVGLTLGTQPVRPTREAVFASPFDFSRQASLYLPRHLPEPTAPDFLDKAIDDIVALIALAGGRTFVLFTSTRAMREVHRRLAPRIPYQVLLQGQKPKGALVRDFKERSSVLFATQSFWEGVDVQGEALSMVIIDKLPFASPGDPLVSARLQAITDRGGNAFGEYQLPSAAIALKQGFGRLIRSRSDTGAVAILDRRLWTKQYGGYLRRSLPACPTWDRFADLKRWWQEERGARSKEA